MFTCSIPPLEWWSHLEGNGWMIMERDEAQSHVHRQRNTPKHLNHSLPLLAHPIHFPGQIRTHRHTHALSFVRATFATQYVETLRMHVCGFVVWNEPGWRSRYGDWLGYRLDCPGVESYRSQWPSDQGEGLRPLDSWNFGFESCRRHRCVLCVVQYRQSQKPGKSRQRKRYGKSTNREQEKDLRKKISVRAKYVSFSETSRPALRHNRLPIQWGQRVSH